jgi:alanyl-tRNA synthetase
MSPEEIEKVESMVNEKIRENIVLTELRSIPIEEAKAMGAMALFGEKYGNFVRIIIFDKNFSVELCGGTHVSATGKIGFFKIISESSVAAGVRRIEAITAQKAEDFVKAQSELLEKVKELLKNPKDLVKAISDLQEEKNVLQKELERLQAKELQTLKIELISKIERRNNLKLLTQKVEVPNADALKNLSFQLRQNHDDLVAVLATEQNGKVFLSIMISDQLVKNKGLDASKIIKDLAKHIEGGGGGQAFYASAAGKNAAGLEKLFGEVRNLIEG